MEDVRIPIELIALSRATINHSLRKLKFNKELLSSEFEIEQGDRQGDRSPPYSKRVIKSHNNITIDHRSTLICIYHTLMKPECGCSIWI